MAGLVHLWHRLGIRRQLTLMAVALVALPLCLGVLVFANLLTRSLSNGLVEQTSQVASRVANYAADHGVQALPGDLELGSEYKVQVVDATQKILWATANAPDEPMSSMRPLPGRSTAEGAEKWWGGGNDDGQDVIVAQASVVEGRTLTVLVATGQEEQHEAVSATAALLLSGVPLVMVAAAVATWWLVRGALRPVGAMTSQLARITSSIGDERVPVPVAEDEVQALGRTMNAMLDRLQRAQQSQRSFVSDASHELRSPVASLSGAIEIGCRADDLDTWRELAPLMTSEIERLGQLTQSMLSLSRADDSGLTLKVVEVDLDDLVLDEAKRLRQVSDKEISTSISPVRVSGDSRLLGQLLVNLGDNAVRHAASRVRVSVREEGGQAVLAVEDDGHGVAEADRERIFDRFVRLEESRNRDSGGSGLGLAIVARIVRAHEGTITVGTAELGGARFEVRLPLG